jgi:tetratricopeptide (TPR) repeat protein
MNIETSTEAKDTANANWYAWQAYAMAAFCLILGVVVGYLVRGSAPAAMSAASTPALQGAMAAPNAPQPGQMQSQSPMSQRMPSLDDMKRMADQQAAPLLAKLQTDPTNADVLNQLGNVYRVTHQFQTAATYYQKALAANPKNVGARTDLASCMFYEGDVDGAITQLEKSLTYDPRHAGTLLNLGTIRWKGKGDAAGAIAAWQKLLEYHPDFEQKDLVERLIAEAKARGGKQPAAAQ